MFMSKQRIKNKKKRRVVVTGLGVISPIGIGKNAFAKALKEGQSGIGEITRFDVSTYPTKIGAEVNDFDPSLFISPKRLRQMDRSTQFAVSASIMAVMDANLSINYTNSKMIGIAVGTSVAGLGWAFEQQMIFYEKGYKRMNPYSAVAAFPNACSSQISIELNVQGPSESYSIGCASSSNAIARATEMIRNGETDVMIVGGTEAPILAPLFGAMCAGRIMSTTNEGTPIKSPRPFDRTRDGMVIGEGAGIVVLEELSHAIKRDANIYAELMGWGFTCDAYSMAKPAPNMKQKFRALKMALDDAKLEPHEIDYICAFGLGEKNSDFFETLAIKKIFGEYAYKIPISSIASMLGQPFGASGALRLISSVLAINQGFIPPTINYTYPDPDCDLDYVPNSSREVKVCTAMINAFGFGGKNVVLIIRDFEE